MPPPPSDPAPAPAEIPAKDRATRVFAGGNKTCVVDGEGKTWCWGGARARSLPAEPSACGTEHRPVPCVRNPVQLMLPGPVVEMKLTRTHGCAQLADGDVWCWGEDLGLSLGSAGAELGFCVEDFGLTVLHDFRPRPGEPEAWFDDARSTMTLYCATEPVQIHLPKPADGLSGWERIPCAHVDGEVLCWGAPSAWDKLEDSEDCGRGPDHGRCAPGPTGVREVDYAVAVGGSWSLDSEGTLARIKNPYEVLADDLEAVTLGSGIGCGLQQGKVMCWGQAYLGPALGPHAAVDDHGTYRAREPVEIGIEARQVELGMGSACALGLPGDVWCWGDERATEIGGQGPTATPRRITGVPAAVEIARGMTHSCARTEAGEVWCWGDDRAGQVGAHDETCIFDVVTAGEPGDCQRPPARVWPR